MAAGGEDFGVDTTAVIANKNAQVTRGIVEFDFDFLGARMKERIHQCLPADAVSLITNDRVQRARTAFDNDLESNVIGNGHFLLDSRESLLEILTRPLKGSQALDGVATLLRDFGH